MGASEAITKQDKAGVAQSLATLTGKTVDELRLVSMALLPREMQGDMNSLALYVMRCKQLNVDPFGAGAYPAIIKGKFQVLVHYATLTAKAYETGQVESLVADCVYKGEEFAYDPQAGTVKHETKPEIRHGIPFGAYCRIQRKDRTHPVVVFVTWEDSKRFADAKEAVWNSSAREMTRKAALKDALRLAFPEILAGVYTGEDFGENGEFKKDTPQTITLEARDLRPVTENTRNRLEALTAKKQMTWDEMLHSFDLDGATLNEEQAAKIIVTLEGGK